MSMSDVDLYSAFSLKKTSNALNSLALHADTLTHLDCAKYFW